MFGEKSSSLASGSPELISHFQLHQPEYTERHLGLRFFQTGDVIKDYIGDGAVRGATILSAKLLTTLMLSSNLVSRYYRDHGPLFPCPCCPSYRKRKAFYLLPLVGGQQYCEHTTLVMWLLVYTVHFELTPFTSCVCLCPVFKHAIY